MDTKIVLNDDEGQSVLQISNCHQDDLVSLTMLDKDDPSCVVWIDQLKSALKKITTK